MEHSGHYGKVDQAPESQIPRAFDQHEEDWSLETSSTQVKGCKSDA